MPNFNVEMPTHILPRIAINVALAEQILVGFIRDQINKAGLSRAVLGLSGGIDSAVSAYLSARALGRKMSSWCGCPIAPLRPPVMPMLKP
jgi:NAD+ synthase